MQEITLLKLLEIGFFIGLGWFLAKLVFVILITKYTGKPIELSKEEV